MGLRGVVHDRDGETYNNPIFTGQSTFADGTSAAPSIIGTSGGATTGFHFASGVPSVAVNGSIHTQFAAAGLQLATDKIVGWGFGASASLARAGANSIIFGAGTTATTTSRTEINKAVTAFTDAAAKTVFTVTVPNAAHHAVLEVEIQGALGAGGAIGAGEAMATNTYKIAIVRTAGVATVATASAATHAVAVAVAGAATVTATAAVSAMSGAVGATQTFTIDVTITKSGGSSDNHTCLAYAKLMNANATGITIA